MKIRNHLLLIILFATNQILAQPLIQKLDRNQGLSNGSITSFVQDENGFIWIGTKNGLNRYDGNEFKVYQQKNSNLRGNDISSLLIDSKKRLWVGTIDGGLNLYLQEQDKFHHFKSNPYVDPLLSSNEIRTIFEDSKSNIWIGTENGLNKLIEPSMSFKSYTVKSQNPYSISHNSIQAMEEDHKGNLWIGTFGGGLNKFDPEKETFIHHLSSGSWVIDHIHTLTFDENHSLLVGTRGKGLLKFDIDTEKYQLINTKNNFLKDVNIIRAIKKDHENNIWVGTDGNGLIKLKATDSGYIAQNFLNDNQFQSSLISDAIYSIFIDQNQNTWIGTAWNGIYVIERNDFKLRFYHGDFTGVDPIPVLSVYKNDSDLWFGSDGKGLNHLNLLSNEINYFKPDSNGFKGNYIQLIKKRKDGDFWLGTFSNGLIHFDPEKGEQIKQFVHNPADTLSISYNDVRDILELPNGDAWIGTWGGGLNYYHSSKQTFSVLRNDILDPKSLSNDNITVLEKSGNGKIWVATFGGGLNLFNPENNSFTRFLFSDSDSTTIASNNLVSLLEDSQGNLWIGTWGNGVNRLDVKTQKIDRFEGFKIISDKTILSLHEDAVGNIWMSTKQGVYKYQVSEDRFYSFAPLNGEYHINSSFKDDNEHLYFGGLEGVLSFDPAHLSHENKQPKVRITDFKLFNKEVEIGENKPLDKQILFEDEIELNYDQDVLTFEFAALKYPISEHCEYAIKMENFDKEWRVIGSNRTVTYTNLSPGDYTFKVKAKVSDGDFGNDFTSVNLTIRKPIWAEWYAYLIYLIVFIGLLYLFRRYSLHWEKINNQLKLEQLSREKETELYQLKQQFFTNISHEIRTPVTLILGSINRLDEKGIADKIQHDSISHIRKNGHHLLNLVNELLDFRKLESNDISLKVAKGNLVKFTKEIFLSFDELAQKKGITYQFESSDKNIFVWYDRDEMEKVIYNLLTNAFKFTDAGGKIVVNVSSNDQSAFIAVKDTGRGIPEKQLDNIFKRFYQSENKVSVKEDSGYGLGLSISHDIIKLHQGEILVESEVDQGTVFTVKLLLGNDHIRKDFLIENFKDSEEVDNYVIHSNLEQQEVVFDFPDQSEMTVLVVEDNQGIRNYLKELLDQHFKILTAENGQEALEKCREHQPDLVISDVMMPVMDGITFTNKLKADVKTSHIPVIILTARTSLIYKKEGLDSGADDYITKPFSETMLKTRVRNLLKTRSLLKEKYKTDMLIQPGELAVNNPDQQFLHDLSQLIEEKIDSDELNAEFISKELGMSHSVIYKKLKSLTGMSIVEFIRDFKLKRAAQLITKHQLSVTDACYRVGFSDRRYFSQVFKSKFGMSPSEYAKENQN